MAASPKNKKQPNKITSLLSSKRNISILLIVIIAAFGAWRVFLSGASPNNCQPEKGVNICDIDQVQGNTDNVLSNGPEAYTLNKNDPGNWPLYFGTAFRAPTAALDGAQPVYRLYNGSVTWHDYMLEAGKKDKEAKNPGKVANEGVVFYAWPDGSRPGTVPVYRLTQGGGTLKVLFTTDRAWRDRAIAADINNANGWKDGGIPFYAFPPTYQAVAANGTPQANPYDCSIKENFVSDRCTAQRNNLNNAIATGVISASNDCPATLEAYIKEPFPSRFPQDCQNKWNAQASNCSIRENFLSDRCRDARAAFEKAEQERIARENAARQAASTRQSSGSSARTGSNGTSGGSGSGSGTRTPPDCNKPAGQRTKYCQDFFAAVDRNNAAGLEAAARLARQLAGAGLGGSQGNGIASNSRVTTAPRTGTRGGAVNGIYSCVISGEQRVRQGRGYSNTWEAVTLRRTFTYYTGSASEVRSRGSADCARWKTQQNAADRYRGMRVI